MKNLSIILAASIFFISCNSGSNKNSDVQSTSYKFPEPKPLNNTLLTPVSNSDSTPKVNAQQPATTTSVIPAPTGTTVTTTQNTKAQPAVNITNNAPVIAKGMNPEHGKPGHRCDIPVGTPLNAPPAQVKAPVVQQQAPVQTVTTTPVPVQSAPVQTAPGMNPPHGQPGHDCAIEVGKPLKKAQ